MKNYFSRSFFRGHVETIALLIVSPLLLFLVWWNICDYPTVTGWDEGMYLQFSSNLSQFGLYGTQDGDHFHPLQPVGGTGPILIGLLALGFKLFGASLMVARTTVAVFMTLALVGLYLFIKEISRWQIGLFSVFLYLIAGYGTYDSVWVGRQILAEGPAFALLFWGLWFFTKVVRTGKKSDLAVTSVLISLTVVTKNQLIWIIGPSLGILFIVDLFWSKEKRWPHFLVIGYLAWYLASLAISGDEVGVYLEAQKALLLASFLRFNMSNVVENVKLFIKSGFILPVLFGLVFGVFSLRKAREELLVFILVLSLAVFGLINALVLSLPWARYLNLGVVLSIPLVSIAIHHYWPRFAAQKFGIEKLVALACMLALCIFISAKLFDDARLVLTTHDHAPQLFAEAVDRQVPENEYILNWEWEVEFFSQRSFVHPDCRLFPAMIDKVYNGIDSPILKEPRISGSVHYFIVGPFASQTELFKDEIEALHPVLLIKLGDYSLYYLS